MSGTTRDAPPDERPAPAQRRRPGPRPPGSAKCARCQDRARNCRCPDGPEFE